MNLNLQNNIISEKLSELLKKDKISIEILSNGIVMLQNFKKILNYSLVKKILFGFYEYNKKITKIYFKLLKNKTKPCLIRKLLVIFIYKIK